MESLLKINHRIKLALQRAGRPKETLTLLGASKKQPPAKILQAAQGGLRDFGENYSQELIEKINNINKLSPDISPGLRWHFIGHLQGNKVKEVLGRVALIHSLDTLSLAQKISRQASARAMVQEVLLEINLAQETNKSGFDPKTLNQQWAPLAALPGIRVRGLMAIPPACDEAEKSRPYFGQLKSLLDECNQSGVFKDPLVHLSMGMSGDFEVAIEEGATIIRLGTLLFGPRT